MECEVIVVGAGIGGLTTAALLAARGVDVCVFERQPEVGGCVANFEHLGYTFEPTCGLYSGWEPGGIWERIFSQLPVAAPGVTKLSPNYVVRLPDGRDIQVSSDHSAFETEIATAFSECADAAIRFFREVRSGAGNEAVLTELLHGTSREFQWFIDAQLQTFTQSTSDGCSLSRATVALRLATGDLWSIDGAGQTLANRLAESLKASGGPLRLNSPVLRLAYGTDGNPIGVDLLSGERVIAKRAIISNLTVWDTYGKLVGPSRTPREVASELKKLTAWGAYLIFLAIDEAAIARLPSPRTWLICDSDVEEYDPENQQLMLNLAIGLTGGAPAGKRALTAIAFTQADEWFSFHEDHSWHDEKDQALLESWWTKLHQSLPQLGDAIEVIETSTPQTVYETARRRLGMIGAPSADDLRATLVPPFPNLFLVGDTASAGLGLEGVADLALTLANHLAPS
ncbi:MAG TPA: FAD-dependent oxidoreductase [Pyrinomonadaceae bacterium]|nr:FAD-dependent oxidoreductase [Pyrinomonadaceae bacterium]